MDENENKRKQKVLRGMKKKEEKEEEHDTRRYVKQRRIGSKNHQLYTFMQSKLAMNINDDKRHWINCNDSVAYGHYSLFT